MKLSQDKGKTSKTGEDPKKEERNGSFFKRMKTSLQFDIPVSDEKSKGRKETKKTVSDVPGKNSTGNGAKSDPNKEASGKHKEDKHTYYEKTHRSVSTNPDEDPTLYMFKNIKEHEKLQSLRKRKDKIIKITAIITSILLIIIGILYSITPNEKVASNVIFGERAMFSVLLILIAFMILAAVFASRLLEHKLLKGIHEDLENIEGKQNNGQEDTGIDPIIQRMNKKNK